MEMTPTVSSISAFPKVVHGLQVLLVESDQSSLQHHVYYLLQNSYRVTSTNKISTGSSMLANGNTFDCVLVDTENFEIDMVQFLHRVLKHQPQMPIIVMAWNDLQVLIAKQTLTNEAIWFLQKPCGVNQICDLLQRVCTRRINYIESASIRKPLQENQEGNTLYSVDTMVNKSTNLNTSMINNNISCMINNNISSSDGGHLGVNINSQKYGAMSKSQSYVDISSDDDEPTIKENICIGSAKNKDRAKKPAELKGKNDQPLMDHIYREKRKGITPRTAWTRALHEAYPIANEMSVPGLTSEHVGSHLQIFQERENNITKPSLVVPFQTANNLQVESYSCKTSGLSVPFNNDASMIQQSSNLLRPLKLNAMGISFMTIDNIKAKLLGAPPLYLPQLNTTTTINYSGGDQVSNYNFGDPKQRLIGDISMSNAFGLANPDNNGTAQGSPTLYLPQLNTTTTSNYSGGDQISNYKFGDPFQPLIDDISMSNAFGLAKTPDNNGTAQGSPPLFLPQLNTTTTINYSGGDQVSTYSFGDHIQPLIGDISMSNAVGLAENSDNGTAQCIETFSNNHTLEEAIAPPGVNATIKPDYIKGADATKFSNCFANVDYGVAGGSSVSETLAQIDRFGISIESYGGGVADSPNQKLKDSTFQEFSSYDLGGVSHPQDVQGNGENLFDVDNSMNLSFLNSDSISFGHASTGFLLPSIAVEENSNQTEIQQHANSIVPMDGSEGKAIDDEWYMKKVRHEFGNPMDNGKGYYGHFNSNI